MHTSTIMIPSPSLTTATASGTELVFKRLGYIVEALGRDQPDLITASQARVSAGISPLDPQGPKGGRRLMRWGLRVNVTPRSGGTCVIPNRDLQQLRAEWTLDIGVIEKDYVLGWLLGGDRTTPCPSPRAGYSREERAFASATTRRSRFSEDLDFTAHEKAVPINPMICSESSGRSPNGS